MAQNTAADETVTDAEIVDALEKIESEASFELAIDARETLTDEELVEAAEGL
jgi:hypothetical protein